MKLILCLCILSAVTALSDEQILQQFESLQKQMDEKKQRVESLEKQVAQLTEKQQQLETQQLTKQQQVELLRKQVAELTTKEQQLEIVQPEICKCLTHRKHSLLNYCLHRTSDTGIRDGRLSTGNTATKTLIWLFLHARD